MSARASRVAVLGLSLAAALSIARSASAQSPPVDVVYLKDGQRLKGQVVSEGETVVVDTPQGRMVVAASDVRHIDRASTRAPEPPLTPAPTPAPPLEQVMPPAPAATRAPSETRLPFIVFDVRAEGAWMFKDYDIKTAGLGERGGGGGAAISLALGHAFVERALPPSWFGLHLGASLAGHYVAYSQDTVPAGEIKTPPGGLQNGDTSFFKLEPSLFGGMSVGLGGVPRESLWYGAIVSLDLAPTMVIVFANDQAGGSQLNPLGIRATIDIGSFDASQTDRQLMFRASFLWLPYLNSLPSMGSAGLGISFY